MTLRWIRESPNTWNESKAELVGNAEPGIFDRRYAELSIGEPPPGEWWRVEDDGEIVGYGWMDVVWGDAEILMATRPGVRGKGVGTFIVEHLEAEARERGLNYLYNVVRPTHPNGEALSAWLQKRGFVGSHDGSLLRAVVRQKRQPA